MAGEEKSLRDTIEEAVEKVDEQEEGGPKTDATESVGTTPEEAAAPAADDTTEPEQDSAPEQKEEKPAAKDAKGTPTTAKDLKAPVSWRPAAREQWNSLPQGIKEEILKREEDVKRVNDGKAIDGQFRSQFEQVVSPFRNYIEANGGNPLQSVRNLMGTAAMLHGGTAQQKATLVRDIIKNFAVDIEMLDKALAGEAIPNRETPDISSLLNKELAPIREFMGQLQNGQSRQYSQSVEQFFSNPKNEFASDLADDMADLMEIAAKRNQAMTLEDAYERASRAHPEISKVLEKRAVDDRLRKQQEELKGKKNAASSVAGSPGGVSNSSNKDMSLRDVIAASFDQVAGR